MPDAKRCGLTRRHLLRVGGAMGVTSLAGCQHGESPTTPTPDESDPVDGPAASTASRRPTTSTPRETIHFDGGPDALSAALRAAEENPGSTIEIEPGTYRLSGTDVGHPQPHSHFTADGLRDVTIEGSGSLLVMTDPTRGALGVFNSERVTIRNLRFDYEPPPMSQATVTAVDPDERTVDVEVQPGFPGLDSGAFAHPRLDRRRRWATVHDPDTGDFLDERSGGASKIGFDEPAKIGERRYRLRNLRPMRGIEPGRLLVVVARLPFKHALMAFNCIEPTIEDTTFYMTPAFAVLAGLCEAPTFRRVTVTPRPDSDRVVASTADGIHVLGCAPGPTIQDCRMERLQDDSYVVASLMNTVREVLDDRTVRVEPLIGTRIRPGDTLAGIGPKFARLGELPAVEAVEETPLQLPGDWGWPVEVTFATPIADTLDVGDFLRNHSRSNQDFAIRNCVSREIRSRHVRVTSRDGAVEGNELVGNAMPAVMLAGGTFFSPQSPPERVAVRNNTIVRSGLNGFTTPFLGAIDAWIHLGGWRAGTRPAGRPIRDLTIAGNTVRNSAFKGIQVNDADGVTVRDNRIEAPNQVGFEGGDYGIGLVNDRAVDLVGNQVRGASADLDQFAVSSTTEGVVSDGNRLTIDGRSVPPEVVDQNGSG